MKANISDETIERLADIRGKPIVKGMDSAINECLDTLENKIVTTDEQGKVIEVCDFTEKMASDEEDKK